MATDEPRDDFFQEDDYSAAEQPPPKKRNVTLIILAVVAVIGGGLLLVCCGGIFYFMQSIEEQTTHVPAEVIERTKEIAQIDIPEEYEPKLATGMNMVFFSMQVVRYERADGNGLLILGEVGVPMEDMQQAQEDQMQDAINQAGQNQRTLQIQKTETREFEIRGRTVPFEFAEGTLAQDGVEYRQITGMFPTEDGTGFLTLQVPEENYDEAAVVQMIESIE